MPQNLVQTVTNTFIKGLITEAGPLTFPKDASIDELNCTLERNGSRRRRLGLKLEENHEINEFAVGPTTRVNSYVWRNVGGLASLNYLVVQLSQNLIFYEMNGESVSPNRVPTSNADPTPYILNLVAYQQSGSGGVANSYLDFATINGNLIVVSANMNAIRVNKNLTTNVFIVDPIDIKERDFQWLGKNASDYTEQLATASVSDNRKYDTYNTGWTKTLGSAALSTYVAAEAAWPPLTHPWYSGKNSSGAFSVAEYEKIYAGNSLIVNGHYIYSIFSKNRKAASGLSSVTDYFVTRRFTTVCEYASRVFYAGMDVTNRGIGTRIYFSQLILDNIEDIGNCYQINDPTSEEFSDLLDTDGGFISIPEATNIRKLHVFGPTLYAFAENGVWAINGVDDVFRASEYSVSKLTEVGLKYKQSFVSAEGRPYWWSDNGIHTLILNDQIGTIVEQNISEATIQTYFLNLTDAQRTAVKAVYDGINKRVMWFYPDDPVTSTSQVQNILFFDEVFTAFYPWKVSTNNWMLGGFYFENTVPNGASSSVKILTRTVGTNRLTFSEFNDKTFLDWGTEDYVSYAEAGYDFMGDLTVFKNAPYVTTYTNLTEEGFTVDGPGYKSIRPSSCLMSAYWDFASAPSTTQEIYRLKFPVLVNEDDLTEFNYPESVITSRIRVRGRGRSMRLRFDSTTGKDFQLLGWEVLGARNPSF